MSRFYQELEIELARLRAEAIERRKAEIRGANEISLKNIPYLLAMKPKHDRTDCSDGKLNNEFVCDRCFLLTCNRDGYWPDDKMVEINIVQAHMKQNDFVRIKKYPEDHINAKARVVAVKLGGVVVSNTKMPFQGTLSMVFFPFDEVEKV